MRLRRLIVGMEERRRRRQREVRVEVAVVVMEGVEVEEEEEEEEEGVDLRGSECWVSSWAQLSGFADSSLLGWGSHNMCGNKPALVHFRRSGPGA